MEHAEFNTPKEVADFFSQSPAKKMHGVCCSPNDGKFHVFYSEILFFNYDEEEDEE